MANKPTYYTDRHILCRKIKRKGKPPIIDMFQDRRAAMTFNTINNNGYYCIFGLKKVVTHRDKLPIEMLAEGEFKEQKDLFASLIRNMRLMHCEIVYADTSKAHESAEIEFEKALRRLNVNTIGLYDASEFEGFDTSYSNFDAVHAPLDEYGRKGLLKIPGAYKVWGRPESGRWAGTCALTRDLQAVGKEDVRSLRPWEMYPGANAFNHLIMSYVISPYQKPEKEHEWTGEGYGNV